MQKQPNNLSLKKKIKKNKGKKEVFHANLEDIINIWDEILLA